MFKEKSENSEGEVVHASANFFGCSRVYSFKILFLREFMFMGAYNEYDYLYLPKP